MVSFHAAANALCYKSLPSSSSRSLVNLARRLRSLRREDVGEPCNQERRRMSSKRSVGMEMGLCLKKAHQDLIALKSLRECCRWAKSSVLEASGAMKIFWHCRCQIAGGKKQKWKLIFCAYGIHVVLLIKNRKKNLRVQIFFSERQMKI